MNLKSIFFQSSLIFLLSTVIAFLWFGFADISYIHGNTGYAIITPDGYYYIDIIEKILNNKPPEELTLATLVFSYFFVLPLKLFGATEAKDILFFIPPFFTGVFGVGALLFAKEFLDNKKSIFAAILAASSAGFVARTRAGYFDTDIFVFSLPIFILAFGIRYLKNKRTKDFALSVFFATFLGLVYTNGSILVLLCFAGFGVLLFDKTQNKRALKKLALSLFAVSFINPTYIIGILSKVNLYLFKTEDLAPDLSYNSNFGFIAESSNIPFFDAINLISGNVLLFIPSVIGLFLLFRQKREIVAILPFLLLGSAAFVLGSRFAPFAAVATAVGLLFFASWAAAKMEKKYLKIAVFGVLLLPSFGINILNAALNDEIGGFHAKETASLAKIKPLVEKNSTVFSRWDYGYELKYYLGAFTPSNNGSMGGAQIFTESAVFASNNQNFAANLMLEANAELRRPIQMNDKNGSTLFVKMGTRKGFDAAHINGYLNYLEQNRSSSYKNTYLLIPTRMIDIFETVQKNANTEFMKGRINSAPFFKFYRVIAENEKTMKLDKKVYIDKLSKTAFIDANTIPLSSIYVVKKESGKTDVFENKLNNGNGMILIFLQELNGYILSDKKSVDTVFVQISIFDKYDETRFEKIYDDKYFKVFKVL